MIIFFFDSMFAHIIYKRNSGLFRSIIPGIEGETSSNEPVPGIPTVEPNQPGPSI